jgi:hypothetical protein
MFDYGQLHRFVFRERKCNFRLALMYYKSFLFPLVATLVSPKKVLAIINAPKKSTGENLDSYYPSRTMPTHTNKMAPSGDSYNMTPMFNGSNSRYTRPTHRVASGDDNSEFEEHEGTMHN